MKTYWKLLCIASLAFAGFATHSDAQSLNSTGAPSPQQMLDNMRATSNDASVNCGYLYDYARRLQIRSPEMGKSLAAVLRLRDVVTKYQEAISWNGEPRPDWLRMYSRNLLDAWGNVEVSFPRLEPTPRVVGSWKRAQDSLVAMYHAASQYIGQPITPLPSALGADAVQPVPSPGVLASPQMLEDMCRAAKDAEINCGHFYDYARQLQTRNPEMSQSLAAILRLRDAAQRYHAGFIWWIHGPQSNWLRECSENLLDAWIKVEVLLPQLEPASPVAGSWDRSQQSLVNLYRVSSPYIGQPIAPLPSALGVRVTETR